MYRRILNLSFVLLLLLGTGCDRLQRSRAEVHFSNGQIKHRSGDLEGAIAEYGKAIALQPNLPAYYHFRGQARFAERQFAAAVDDGNECLRLAPDNPDYYFLRALARRELGEVEEALADLDRAIALKPSASAHANRALTLVRKGDFAKALADCDAAVRHAPGQDWTYQARADVKISMEDLEGALADLKKAAANDQVSAAEPRRARALIHTLQRDWRSAQRDLESIADDPGSSQAYIHIFLWICRMQQGHTEPANEALAQFKGKLPHEEETDWPREIITFLLGKLTEADFLAASASTDAKTDHDQRCEAFYYAAVKRQLAGDEPGAIDLYRQCVETKHYAFYEYRLARQELKRLGKLQ